MEERVFYILYSASERLNAKELVRAIAAQTYGIVMSKEKKMSRERKAEYERLMQEVYCLLIKRYITGGTFSR